MTSDIVSLDIQDLTVEEVELIEDYLDLPIDQAFGPNAKRGKLLRAVAFVTKRREDPTFTWEQAGALKVKLAADTDPTPAASAS
jgi:hypothetical protein